MAELRLQLDYATTLDRAGLALGAGALAGGVLTALLRFAHGGVGPIGLASAFVLGVLISAALISALGGPIWLFFQRSGRRRVSHAALAGALAGFFLFLFGQTYGFGLFPAPPSDDQTMLFRWISAAATSSLMAIFTAAIAVIMWRVAYRPR